MKVAPAMILSTVLLGGTALIPTIANAAPLPSAHYSAQQTALVGKTLSMTATAYGPSLKDNYPYGPVDAFGKPLVSGDVAVDPRVIPLGTRLYVSGYHTPYLPAGGFVAVARDTGGAIKGNRIDLFINGNASEVSSFGIQHVTVKVLGPTGSNPPTVAAPAPSVKTAVAHPAPSHAQTVTLHPSTPTPTVTKTHHSDGDHDRDDATASAAPQAPATVSPASPPATASTPSSSAAKATNSISPIRQSIVNRALAQVGDPYVWGGTSPAGFDCSGLTQWVYAKNGIRIPRLVKAQMAFGTPIKQSQLRPGDLVFFHTYLPGASHVGIYIGKHGSIAHAFVAADNPSVGVRIDNLDTSKWQTIYVGADSYLP